MNHVVIKQVLEMHLSAKTDSFRVQQEMSACFKRDLMPVLERVFDQFGKDDHIRIDRLELNLGSVNLTTANWSSQLAQALEIALTDRLTQTLSSPNALGISRTSRPQSRFSDWLFFLKKGRLPWVRPEPMADWQPDLLAKLATTYQAVDQFRRLLQTAPVAMDRLVLQYSPAFLKTLIETCTGHGQQALWAGWLEMQLLFDRFGDRPFMGTAYAASARKADRLRAFTVRFWKWMLRATLRPEHPLKATRLLTDFWLEQLPELTRTSSAPKVDQLTTLGQYIQKQGRQYPVLKPIVLSVIQQSAASVAQTPKSAGQTAKAAEGRADNRAEKQPTEESSDRKPATDTSDPKSETDLNGVQYVNNAGIVLLNPFFAPLFRKLDWLDGAEFRDKLCQQKALVLLHFLATGETQPAEHELVLPKLLCAWPAEEPVDAYVDLLPEETAEAEVMMATAIEHWGALGNVSPAALREGYLQREGRLVHEQEKWGLQIEAKTLDILLDKLPFGWSIGHIRLPWMNHLLTIDWR